MKEIRRYVPGYVFQQSPFKFLPLGFTILTKGETQELMYPRSVQEAGFNKFCEQPFGGTELHYHRLITRFEFCYYSSERDKRTNYYTTPEHNRGDWVINQRELLDAFKRFIQ